jgi:ribonuclease Z
VVFGPGRTPLNIQYVPVTEGIVLEDDSFELRAFPVSHRGPDCLGYIFREKEKRPFLADKAAALGVPAGPVRRDLVAGKPVQLADGSWVQPEQVLGDLRPGVKLCHVGDTGRTDDLAPFVADADALVIEATYLTVEEDLAREFGHLTAAQSARLALEANVKTLYLTHISRRYQEKDVLREAQDVFPNTIVARDFDQYRIARMD